MKTEEPVPAPSLPAAALPPLPASPAAADRFPWVRAGIMALAAVLRLWDLDLRPPHFDEGVNGWFTDQMQHLGCYQYDPSNYHGPLHFYVLFLFKVLFGRHLWALRLPVVLVGILTVDWTLRFDRFLGRRTAAWAALAMALSPGFLYYQRDAIHETWLAFFLILGCWGIFGLWQDGAKRYLWAVGMGLTGAVLTKETYVIHVGCLLLAVPCLLAIEALYPSARTLFAGPGSDEEQAARAAADAAAPPPLFDEAPPWASPVWRSFAPQSWRERDAWTVFAVGMALIFFFYSGNGFHFAGLRGLVTAYAPWGHKAQEGEGHNKPFLYWTRLLMNNEPFAMFGLAASFFYAVPSLPVRPRAWLRGLGALLLLAGAGAFVFLTEKYSHLEAVPGALAPHPIRPALYLGWWTLAAAGFALGGACLGLPAPRDWRVRLLAIYGLGNLVAYSLIPYKTPWCAISFDWPFLFVGGAAMADLADRAARFGLAYRWEKTLRSREMDPAYHARMWRTRVYLIGAAVLAVSAFLAIRLNYFRPTDEKEPYVYVQTFPDLWKITDPMVAYARKNPLGYHMPGVILCGSTYPLPWVLGDFTAIGYYADDAHPPDYRADFLLVVDARVAEVEAKLKEDYFKQTVHLRSAQVPLELYFRASLFQKEFPGRRPEFRAPKSPPAVPAVPAIPVPLAPR